MDQTEQRWSESEPVSGPRIWCTREVDPAEAFDYYHEGICSAFMPLRPELDRDRRHGFSATHYAYGIGASTLNLVAADAHLVTRGRSEIAASTQDCCYLNLQLDGNCRIMQNDRAMLLLPGDVGLFDSSQSFGLHHERFPRLKVASLMLPKSRLGEDHGNPPQTMSRHPVYGRLIAEAMQTLLETVTAANPAEAARLHELVVSLVKMAIHASPGSEKGENEGFDGNGAQARRSAQLLRIKRIIRARCTAPGYTVAACATEAGLSERYIHRLFETDGAESFGSFLMAERLAVAARRLESPASAHLPIAAIAAEAGFADASHFTRAFRARYGMTPGDWRRR